MTPFSDLRERLRALFFPASVERDLDEELRFHLEQEAAARRRAGSAEPDRDARLALGSLEDVKERVRDARGIRPLADLLADVRFAGRTLRRNAGFTAAVVVVLGLAVGAATAVYVVAHRVLLAPLPFPDPERLVRVDQHYGSGGWGTISVVDIQAIAAEARSFEAFGAVRGVAMSLTGGPEPERVAVGRAMAGFFRALDVQPARGRLIEPADEAPGAPPVAVVTDALAERMFGGADRAVGGTIGLNGVRHAVVGVLEPGRNALIGGRTPVWTALQLETPARRGPFGYRGIARLRDGVSLEQAQQELAAISARLFPVWRSSFQDSTARLAPVSLRVALTGYARAPVGLFAGAVVLVLLAAVANVATLLLVRASAREHELAVRAALGAGRARLARLVGTESLVLTLLAALLAVAIATIGVRFAPLLAPNLPRIAQTQMTWPAVGFAAVTAALCGVLMSLAPLSVVAASGATAARRLASGGSGGARSGASPGTTAARGALVIAEFALAFPLLVGAGLLFTSFLRLQRIDLQYDPAAVYALDITLAGPAYASDTTRLELWRRLEARAAELPGLTAVGLAGSVPPDNYGNVNNFNLVDRPVPPGTSEPLSPWVPVTQGYFDALEVRLLAGRWFTAADSAGAPPVVLVSRAWAQRWYPRDGAVGRQMRSAGCTSCPLTTVVGVVEDVHYRGLGGEADAVYEPLAQAPGNDLHLVARSRLAPAEAFRALRAALGQVDPTVAPVEVVVAERVTEALGDPRRWTLLVGGFACAGLLLAALGVFGLMSYVVRQRQRELGVRLALGAAPASLTALVVRRGMRYAAIGTALGVMLAFVQARWLAALLYGIDPIDPAMLVLAAAGMLGVAALACWLPGLKAARVRPIEALSSS